MRKRANQQREHECCCWLVLILTVKIDGWQCGTKHLIDSIHVSIPAPLRFGHLGNWETSQTWKLKPTENLCKFSFLWT